MHSFSPSSLRILHLPNHSIRLEFFSSSSNNPDPPFPHCILTLDAACAALLLSQLDYLLGLPTLPSHISHSGSRLSPGTPYASIKSYPVSRSLYPTDGISTSYLDTFLSVVHTLPQPLTYERSFQVRPSAFTSSRFLAGFDLVASHKPESLLHEICSSLAIPESSYTQFLSSTQDASALHLGYEDQSGLPFFKIYLEYPAQKPPYLRHSALKYSPTSSVSIFSDYTHVHFAQALDIDSIFTRDEGSLQSDDPIDRSLPLFVDTTRQILDRTVTVSRFSEIECLAVSESGTSRLSYDLNLYPLELPLTTLDQHLLCIMQGLNLDSNLLYDLLNSNSHCALAHLSYGRHRNGSPFLTVYFRVPSF